MGYLIEEIMEPKLQHPKIFLMVQCGITRLVNLTCYSEKFDSFMLRVIDEFVLMLWYIAFEKDKHLQEYLKESCSLVSIINISPSNIFPVCIL